MIQSRDHDIGPPGWPHMRRVQSGTLLKVVGARDSDANGTKFDDMHDVRRRIRRQKKN